MARGSGLTRDPLAAAQHALGLPASKSSPAALETAARAAWDGFDAPTRALIAALVEMGGAAGEDMLAGEIADQTATGGDKPSSAVVRADAGIASAWERGLICRDRGARTFFLVPEIATAFAPCVREALDAALPPATPPLPVVDDHLICCALNLLRHEPLRLTREGTPFRRHLETLAEKLRPLLPQGSTNGALPRETVDAADDLVRVLKRLGLLLPVKDALVTCGDAVERWASLDEGSRAAALLPREPDSDALRLLVLMQSVGADRAWPVAVAARVLRRSALAAREDDPVGPALTPAQSLAALTEARTALASAGLVAPTRIAGEPGEHLALTATGRSFPAPADLPRPRGVHVGHDLAVLVPRGIPAAVHARIGDLALLEAADHAARYRLDRAAVLHALDRGSTAAELELFLAQHATPVLPDTVRDDIRRWAERFGEVTSHEGICVACSAPKRHDEFEAVVRRSGLAVTVVAPGVAIVAREDHPALCESLATAGLVPRRRVQAPPRGSASAAPAAAPDGPPTAASLWDDVPAEPDRTAATDWCARFRDAADRVAAPPPTLVTAQIKDRYKREFGSKDLASLDRLDVDELLDLEEKGLVRQYLAGRLPDVTRTGGGPDVHEYVADEMVSVTPARAELILSQAARASLRCQIAYLQGPGRTQKLVIIPIEIVTDGAGTYVRSRVDSSSQERMLATTRIHALRIVR